MPAIGHGFEICTYTTRPSNPTIGTIIYQTDTDEHLKYVTDVDGTARWMQIELKPNRNILINGDMRVWQRGTSINAGGGGASTYAMDRWCFGNNNTSSYNMSQVTNVPNSNFLYSGRITANTATVYGLNGWEQYIEQANMIRSRNKYVTLSFWVRGSKTYSGASFFVDCGTTVDQMPGNGNAFTGGVTLINQSVNITTSWQKVATVSSVVVPATANVMRVGLPKSTFVQNDWIEITGVQLESGTAISEFEFEAYETTIMKCQRYFQRYSYTDNTYYFPQYPTQVDVAGRPETIIIYSRKRIKPVITVSNGTHFAFEAFNNTAYSCSAYQGTLVGTGLEVADMFFTAGGLAAGTGGVVYMSNSGAYIDINAEL